MWHTTYHVTDVRVNSHLLSNAFLINSSLNTNPTTYNNFSNFLPPHQPWLKKLR